MTIITIETNIIKRIYQLTELFFLFLKKGNFAAKTRYMEFEYLAFISYSHNDIEWAKWLQESLEFYQLPTYVHEEHPRLPTHLRPIFRDQTDLELGTLKRRIHQNLAKSKFLIVICSPSSATSKYVEDEIAYFLKARGKKYIIPFIISGSPSSRTEGLACFPPSLRELQEKPLAANIKEYSKEYAMVKVVSYLLDGIAVRKLWDRYAIAKEEAERKKELERMHLLKIQSRFVAEKINDIIHNGDSALAKRLAVEILPKDLSHPERPFVPEAEKALRNAFDSKSLLFPKSFSEALEASFGQGDSLVASTFLGGSILIWNAFNGQQLIRINTGNSISKFASHICFTSDGSHLVFDDTNSITVCNLHTKEAKVIKTPTSMIGSITPLSTPNHILSVGQAINVWDIENGLSCLEISKKGGESGWQKAIVNEEARVIIALTWDNERVQAISMDSPNCIIWEKKMAYGFSDSSIACSRKMDFVFLKDGSEIVILDITNGKELYRWKIGLISNGSGAFAVSHDGQEIAAALDFDVVVYDISKLLSTGRIEDLHKELYQGHSNKITSLSFSIDDSVLLSSSYDGTVRIFDINKAQGKIIIKREELPVSGFRHALFYSNSSLAVIREDNGSVGLCDYDDHFYYRLLKNRDFDKTAQISHNGHYYCSVDEEDTIHYYNLLDASETHSFQILDTINRCVKHDPFDEYTDEQASSQIRVLSPQYVYFSPDDCYLLITTSANPFWSPRLPEQYVLYRLKDFKEVLRGPMNTFMYAPAFSCDSSSIFVANEGHLISILIESGSISELCSLDDNVTHILCPHNNDMVICTSGQFISAYNSKTGNLIYRTDSLGDLPIDFVSLDKDYCLYSLHNGIKIFRADSGVVVKDIVLPEDTSLWYSHYDSKGHRILAVLTDGLDLRGYIKAWPLPTLSDLIKSVNESYKGLAFSEEEKKKYYLV